jgi:hypothetical protein
MRNLGMDLFTLARKQLEKKKIKFTFLDVIDRAVKIRRRLDRQEEKRVNNFKKS